MLPDNYYDLSLGERLHHKNIPQMIQDGEVEETSDGQLRLRKKDEDTEDEPMTCPYCGNTGCRCMLERILKGPSQRDKIMYQIWAASGKPQDDARLGERGQGPSMSWGFGDELSKDLKGRYETMIQSATQDRGGASLSPEKKADLAQLSKDVQQYTSSKKQTS